jgi:hypothetical protein
MISVKVLENILKEKTADLFLHRKKDKLVKVHSYELNINSPDLASNCMSFELSAYNLVRNARNCKMVLGDLNECILWSESNNSNRDCEHTV